VAGGFRIHYDAPLVKITDVAAQERAVALLAAALEHDRVHHALLFTGPSGVGKETAARALAASLLCTSRGGVPVVEACGVCDACRRVERDVHPDLLVLMPEAEAIARGRLAREDLAHAPSRDLKIEQVRALEAQLALAPLGPRRVVLLVQADAMNPAAQNAFLKTLEEPPSGTHLLLLAEAEGKLVPTLRSRCVRVPFVPLPVDLVAARLMEQKGLDRGTAELCAALSGGSLGRALALDPAGLEDRAGTLQAIEELTPDDVRPALSLAEAIGADGRDPAETRIDAIALFYRDVAAAAEGAADTDLAHRDLAVLARSAAERGVPDALRRHQLALQAREALRRHGAGRLAAERMLLGFLFPELP
jgi:DNA polymerase-3 subunit delta'